MVPSGGQGRQEFGGDGEGGLMDIRAPGPLGLNLPALRRAAERGKRMEIPQAADMLALLDLTQELVETLKHARKCIEWCRKNHKDIQSGDGVPIERFIDAAIAKAEGRS